MEEGSPWRIAMPNGYRDPYRHDGGLNNPPSPAHTSDSETTASQKQAYNFVFAQVRRYAYRWKKVARARARARQLKLGRLLPVDARTPELCQCISQVPGPLQLMV